MVYPKHLSFEHLNTRGAFDYLYEAGYTPTSMEEVNRDHSAYTDSLKARLKFIQLTTNKGEQHAI